MRMGRFSWPKISWKRKRKQVQVQGRKGSQRTLGRRAKEAERMLSGVRSTPGQALSLQTQEGPLVSAQHSDRVRWSTGDSCHRER